MVALFVACALVPVGVTLAISYGSVHELLVAQRIGLLRGEAAGYGTTLIERLNVAETLARAIGDDLAAKPDLKQIPGLESYFRGGVILEASGASRIFGEPTAAPTAAQLTATERRLAAGGAQIVLVRSAQTQAGVWFVQQVPSRAGRRRVALEVRPQFLWSDDQLPYLTERCVLAADGALLNCARPPSRGTLEAARAGAGGSNGDFAWHDGDERFLSGYREVFLRARFGAEPWIVVVSQPEAYALRPVRALGWLVLPIVLLGLLLAALLGLTQVRRALQPLKELTEATVRIARGEFSARLPAGREDEFGALADAFNAMSQRLGRQFNAIQAHSEINAVILSSMDLAEVAAIVLKRVADLVAADRYYLLLADRPSAERFMLFGSRDEGRIGRPTLVIDAAERQRLTAARSGATSVGDLAERHVFALPILPGSEFGGALVLAYDAPRQPNEEEVELLLGLANRVAVALATARRDEELYRRANFDPLTGLPNRLLGADTLSRASPQPSATTACSRFFSSTSTASRRSTIRPDTPPATRCSRRPRRGCSEACASRTSSPGWAATNSRSRSPSCQARRRLARGPNAIEALSRPYVLRDGDVFVSASIGIAALSRATEPTPRSCCGTPTSRCTRRSKAAGASTPSSNRHEQEVRRRAELATELRQALEKDEFELYYQPQLDVRSGRFVGAEALIRWRHPRTAWCRPAISSTSRRRAGSSKRSDAGRLGAASAQFVAWRDQGLDARAPCRSTSRRASCRSRASPRRRRDAAAGRGCRPSACAWS